MTDDGAGNLRYRWKIFDVYATYFTGALINIYYTVLVPYSAICIRNIEL